MRLLCMLAAVAALSMGCTRETTEPANPEEATDPNGAGGQQEAAYFGKPIGYWVGQAESASPSEDVGRTVEALTLALASSESSTAVAAADALTAIGPPAAPAAPKLAGMLQDEVHPWVRSAAAAALVAIGEQAVPALADTVRTGPGSAPFRAAMTLEVLGPKAKEAIPALEEALAKTPEASRARWEQFLAKIDPSRSGGTEQPDTPQDGTTKVVLPESPITPPATAEDWPQFHGPRRDSICRETGLLGIWPESGPRLLWRLEGLGRGYSTVSIAGGRIYTMGDQTRDGQDEAQYVLAYDLNTREELWATRVGSPHGDGGPRCTPTVAGQLLYALGTDGDLVCLAKETGNEVWRRNLVDDFGGKMMSGWKYSESPLVDGQRLICTPGGDDATIVALDKQTGELIWKSAVPPLGPKGKDGAAYSSAVVAEIAGVRQYVQLLGRGVAGIEADSGRFLWGYNKIANGTANITAPVVRGNYVFVTTAYNTGCALLEIVPAGDGFEAREVYFLSAREFSNHHGGVVLVGDYLYGGSGGNRGVPVCIDVPQGEVAWTDRPLAGGSASVVYADGHVIFRYDRGLVALVEATPEGFHVEGSFEPETGDGPAWPHPVVHDGKLYLRHGDLLLCYDIRSSGSP